MDEMIKQIFTKNAPEAIGCYSQAVQYDKLLFSSGQIPVNPENGEIVSGGIVPQAEQVMENIGAILKEAGTDYRSVLKTTCFLIKACFNSSHIKLKCLFLK
jgi:2-iminobutanoate/2-iminopropanoate deaminase